MQGQEQENQTIYSDYNSLLAAFADQPVAERFFRLLGPRIVRCAEETGMLVPSLEVLRDFPEGSFAHQFLDFLEQNNLTIFRLGRPRQQLHDVLHTLLEYDNSPAGEQRLHAFSLGAWRLRSNGPRPLLLHTAVFGYWSVRCRGLNVRDTSAAFFRGWRGHLDLDSLRMEDKWGESPDAIRALFAIA